MVKFKKIVFFSTIVVLVTAAAVPSLVFAAADAWAHESVHDAGAICAAFLTHLTLHEIGHQVVAEEAGAKSPKMQFFAKKDGKFYPGISTHKGIPEESKLSYAVAGERMAGYTFEYALQSYRRKETTYNKALMFFSCTDFLWYTLLANYVNPDADKYDPNLIREETGLSKEAMLALVSAKTLMNLYRIYNEDAPFKPLILLDTDQAAFVVRYDF